MRVAYYNHIVVHALIFISTSASILFYFSLDSYLDTYQVAIVVGGRNFFCADTWLAATSLDRAMAYQIGYVAIAKWFTVSQYFFFFFFGS